MAPFASASTPRTPSLLALFSIALLAPRALAQGPTPESAVPEATAPAVTRAARSVGELYPVVRVIDGDTIHIERGGKTDKLRLLSVDTEEKLGGGGSSSPSKPKTVYGEETTIWAQDLFNGLAGEDGVTRVGLRFPGGLEARDVYGRLLCHVILEDGRDFNLMLVEEGRSPYFNKYGNSRIDHEGFVRAQLAAQEAKLGVWNPETNAAKTEGAPEVKRPYGKLMPWWQIRADAIEGFRTEHAENPTGVVDGERPEQLDAAVAAEGESTRVFASIFRTFDEDDGSMTILCRAADPDRSLRLVIAKDDRPEFEDFDFAGLQAEFRQNYFWAEGELEKDRREGFRMKLRSADQLQVASPVFAARMIPPRPRRDDDR